MLKSQIIVTFFIIFISFSAYSQGIWHPYGHIDPINEPLYVEFLAKKNIETRKAEKIKSLKIKSFKRDYVNTPFHNLYNEFDENGNMTLSKWDKYESSFETFTFDLRRNITKYEDIYKGKVKYTTQYEYDNNDNLIRVKSCNANSIESIIEYKYDTEMNLVEIVKKNNIDIIKEIRTLKYEKSGNNISVYLNIDCKDTLDLDCNPRLRNKTHLIYKYKFDEKRNIIEKYSADLKSNRHHFEIFAYDDNKNIIEYEEYRIEGSEESLLQKIGNTFDDNNTLIKSKVNLVKAGTISYTYYGYDKFGNIIQEDSETIYTSSGNKTSNSSIIIFEYEFYQ